MRFGLSVPPFTDPAEVVALAVRAEESGWDGFFLWDHLRWDGVVDVHDPWVLLGAIAERTRRIRLGTMVTPVSRRRAQVVAKHLTTLDHLSAGRTVFGVGLGDPPDLDFSDFGDEPSYAVRARQTDEALDLLAELLGDGPRALLPRPVQTRIPIWVAGRAPHTRPLARAKRWDGYAPIADPFLSPADLASYVGDHPRPDWDLVAQWTPGVPAEKFEGVGVTWLINSVWPREDGWLDELGQLAGSPPS